jgi:broad specificity phosphatase PhoE
MIVGAMLLGVVAVAGALADTKIVPCEGPVTTIIVVRHADRAGTADSLSTAGVERAQGLAQATRMANLRAIYVTDTRRSRDTATATAAIAHVTPEVYSAKECDELVKRILKDHAGEAVLVVGHSNTVPDIIRAAGGPQVAEIGENVYTGLYIVAVTGTPICGATLVQLQYGKTSP